MAGPAREDVAEGQVSNQAESPVLRGKSGGNWGELLTGLRNKPGSCSQVSRVPTPKAQIQFCRGSMPLVRTAIGMWREQMI